MTAANEYAKALFLLAEESGKTEKTLEDAALLAKEAVVAFEKANISVIRLGLHASEELDDGITVVSGPYHPAFGEIVESLIFRDKIEQQLLNDGIKDGKLKFFCEKSEVSKAVGHKKSNKIYFKEKYDIELFVSEK